MQLFVCRGNCLGCLNGSYVTATPTVNTTSTGSPEVLTPTSYITFADVAKRREYDDVGLPFLVDCCRHLSSL